MSQSVNVRSVWLVSLGGVLGTLLRVFIGELITDSRSATLIANLSGIALASFLVVLMERRGNIDLRHFLLPGFCAGLTTFSAMAVYTLEPSNGAVMYIATTVIASLAVIAIVIPFARKVISVRS